MPSLASLRRELEAMMAPLRRNTSFMAHTYSRNAVKYAHDVLKVRHLAPAQAEVLQEYANNDRCRILVPSANETGKSFVASCIMSHHYDCYRPSLTFCTAPSQSQVDDIVFRQLRLLRRGDPGFSPRKSYLSDDHKDHICKGFTAVSGTSFQGRHDARVLLIIDEGEDVDDEFFEAAESFAHQIIVFYNPTKTDSHTAFEERRGGWKIIRMSALDHPNVVMASKGMPAPIPNAVTLERVISRLKKWSTILHPDEPMLPGDVELCGVKYRPGPAASARVLGVRPDKAYNSIFNARSLHDCVTKRHEPKGAVQIGCDVARFGDDFSVFHVRQGMASLHHEGHNGWNGTQVARRLRQLCIEYGGGAPQEVPVLIDDTGQKGGSIIDQSQGFHFIPVNVALPSNEPEEYPNLRSQLHFDFEEIVRAGFADFSRIDETSTHDIIEQLLAGSYDLDGKGRRVVRKKALVKESLSRSPDDADAVLLAYYQFPETLEAY